MTIKLTAAAVLVQLVAICPVATANNGCPDLPTRDALPEHDHGASSSGPESTPPTAWGLSVESSTKRVRLSYRLSEDATTTFKLARRADGRWVAVGGSFRHAGRAGENTVSVRLSKQPLRGGRYQLVGVPRDAVGNVGHAVVTRFVVRRAPTAR
jgi:hypothetical protein